MIELDRLEDEIRQVLNGFNVVTVDYTEQSDKDFVIVRTRNIIRWKLESYQE